ncbi:male sterility protein-domain-containing protein, partial [Hysterangium stoloniferum]
ILLTGANGMLGSQVLARILFDPLITVYCVLRGDPWERMLESFRKHGLTESILQVARARGSLRLLKTTDLCSEKLGVSAIEYSNILENVDTIVHAAWKVNFNLPLAEFEPFISCSRALAELSCEASKRVRYHFIGSYASTFNYQETLHRRDSFVLVGKSYPSYILIIFQGYSISKLIAENSLLRIHKQYSSNFDLSIIRVGQICGESTTGSWSRNEMMPMMIASLPVIGAFPRSFPNVSWIPSDVCADALRDVVVSSSPITHEGLQIIHLANPHITPWTEVVSNIAEIAGLSKPELLPFPEYIKRIREHGHGQGPPLPVSRLLPYFIKSLEEGTMPEKYASLCVSESLKYSPALAKCPPIASAILQRIVHHLIPISPLNSSSPVFLFGPWSATPESQVNQALLQPIRDRLFALSIRFRAEFSDDLNTLE